MAVVQLVEDAAPIQVINAVEPGKMISRLLLLRCYHRLAHRGSYSLSKIAGRTVSKSAPSLVRPCPNGGGTNHEFFG